MNFVLTCVRVADYGESEESRVTRQADCFGQED
jgi:hypothetical protein